MTRGKKIAIVVGGYLLALGVACAVREAHIASTAGPDRTTYQAMYGFGDDLLFLGAFGGAGLVPTGVLLWFLRSRPWFWRVLSGLAVLVSITGLLAIVALLLPQKNVESAATMNMFLLVPLRVLAAPVVASGFLLAGALAPSRNPRLVLLFAAACESALFVAGFFRIFRGHGGA